MDQRKLIILGCLVLLLTAGLLRWYTDYAAPIASHKLSPNLLPDSVVFDLKQQSFDDQGKLAYSMQAKHAEQFEEKAVAQLETLTVTLFKNGHPDWNAQAQQGLAMSNGEIIELTGDVVIQQDHDYHEEPTKLSTASLLLSPKKEYAETLEPVTIQQGTSITHAIGMNVDIHAGEIILLSNVKSRYETTP